MPVTLRGPIHLEKRADVPGDAVIGIVGLPKGTLLRLSRLYLYRVLPSPLRDRVGYSDHDRFRAMFVINDEPPALGSISLIAPLGKIALRCISVFPPIGEKSRKADKSLRRVVQCLY